MKIGYHGCNLPEGKVKYNDPRFLKLVDKCRPKKISPYYAEFIRDEFVQTEAIVISRASVLDLLINDIEKIESRLERTESESEKALLRRCIEALESEQPLCDIDFSTAEREILRSMGFLSLKPVVLLEGNEDPDRVIGLCLDKAGIVFFYTCGPKEVHAWAVEMGSDIVTCAGKIHTDLARGFIRADVAHFDDYIGCHNWNDCQKKGLVNVVDRDYVIQPGDIIEIRFAV